MRVFEIEQDMDHAGMRGMKHSFDDLACSSEDVCLDFSKVQFLDSAGIDGVMALFDALRRHSLKMATVHLEGQPLRMLRQLHLVDHAPPERAPRLS